jgi:hypothetical protein
MKRLSAIVLSLLLFWVQVFVAVPPVNAESPAKSNCCSCQRNCCVTQSNPVDSATPPAVPTPSIQLNLGLFAFAASPAWLLPPGEADVFSAACSSPLSAARIPLFTRDCALLI